MMEQCRGLKKIIAQTCKFTKKVTVFFSANVGCCDDKRHYVCVCAPRCVCVFLYMCLCIHVCVYLFVVCKCVRLHMCVFVCTCLCVHLSMCLCVCTCMCVWVFMCMCICVSLCLCMSAGVCMCVLVCLCLCTCLTWTCSEVIRHSQRCRRGCRICTRCIASDRSSQQPSCSLWTAGRKGGLVTHTHTYTHPHKQRERHTQTERDTHTQTREATFINIFEDKCLICFYDP